MTQAYRKKLIEVALPLKAINEASAREKSIRHGHPSTLHLWWARRPLAACRAVLFASLVDDPDSDPMFAGNAELAANKRAELFNLIEDLVKWENSNNPAVINKARAEIARSVVVGKLEAGELKKDDQVAPGASAYEIKHMLAGPEDVNAFLAEHAPPVLDPFCGGGSIPLEAQRLGLRAYASDLNPVPVLITKALIEIPPKFAGRPPVNPDARKGKLKNAVWQGAQGLAEDVRYYGKWMRDEAEKRIGHLYRKVEITAEMAKERPDLTCYVGQELTVIAWLWARTVASPNPAANGAHVPLVRSFWLSTKRRKEAFAKPIVDRSSRSIRFEVETSTPSDGFDPRKGTVVRTGATCLMTGTPISFDHIRSEGKAGRLGTRLLAIVAQAGRNRLYLSPHVHHEEASSLAPPTGCPDTALPEQALSIRVMLYGIDRHQKLYTNRQLNLMVTLCNLVREATGRILADAANASVAPRDYADAIAIYLGEAVSKTAAFHCTLAAWRSKEGKSARAFGRQSLPMVWDFAEVNPFADAGGAIEELFSSATTTIRALPAAAPGIVTQRDATQTIAVGDCLISTDPPYYDNVGYADLSDFYYAWLRKSLGFIDHALFSTVQTPKRNELIATPYRHDGNREKARDYFEYGLTDRCAKVVKFRGPPKIEIWKRLMTGVDGGGCARGA